MKTRALPPCAALAFAAFLSLPSAAQGCEKDALAVFPASGSVVPTNARFILEGKGAFGDKVRRLAGREVFLKSGDSLTSAKVTRGWTGEKGRAAVIIRPKMPLSKGRTYRLLIDEALGIPSKNFQRPTWKAGPREDTKPPAWLQTPAVVEGAYETSEGKPVRRLRLRLPVEDESPTYAVLTLTSVAEGEEGSQSYFIPIRGGEAWLEEGGCAGAFMLGPRGSFRARVEAYDSAGNRAPKVPPLLLRSPQP